MKKIFRNKLIWVCLFFLIMIGINFFQNQRKNEVAFANPNENVIGPKKDDKKENEEDEKIEISTTIMVDVKGAINHPGVFQLDKGNRVFDAIRLAGGLRKDADENKVNLAGKLVDEMVIYVPKDGEKTIQPTVNSNQNETENQNNDMIDINHASQDDLEKIPGIGPTKAKNILEYIETKGPFTSIDQLDEVNGIGKKSLEQMKPFILIR